MTYTNPVWPDYFADPFVLKHAGEYYAYGTGPRTEGLEFPLLYSRDLIHWESLGGALTPLTDPTKGSYWAPEVAERNGRFYMYYSAGGREGEGHRLRLALSDHPAGPFEDTGQILLPDEPFSIDASPFCDPKDGQWYLFFAKDYFEGNRPGTGVAVVALNDQMLPVGEVNPVLRAQADWQVFERNRFWYEKSWEAWHTVEGPFVVFHEGRYYCLYSGGRWESEAYGVGYGVADSVLGPYRDGWNESGPCVLRGIADQVLGPGHNSVVLGPDDRTEFIVYHAWDRERTARRLFIDPLIWTPEGPRCAGPTYTPQEMPHTTDR